MTHGTLLDYSYVDQSTFDWVNPNPLAPLSYTHARVVLSDKIIYCFLNSK